jgi:WD40 repeat protein
VTSVAFGTTGEGRLLLVSASVDKTVRWWEMSGGNCVLTLRRRSGVRSIAVSGALLAIGDDEGVSVIEPALP